MPAIHEMKLLEIAMQIPPVGADLQLRSLLRVAFHCLSQVGGEEPELEGRRG